MPANAIQTESEEIGAELALAGAVGFDPASLLVLLLGLIQLLAGCFTPAQALTKLHSLARGQWYPGYLLHLQVLRQRIRQSGCCGRLGTCTDAEVEAALLDAAGAMNLARLTAMYAAVKP